MSANQMQWTDAMQLEVVFQLIPDKIDWNSVKLPENCTIPAARSMLARLRKKHGISSSGSGGNGSSVSAANTPARRKAVAPKTARGKKAAKAAANSDKDDDDDAGGVVLRTPAKRKKTPAKKSKEFIEEEDEEEEEEDYGEGVESPTKKVKAEKVDDNGIGFTAVNGKPGKVEQKSSGDEVSASDGDKVPSFDDEVVFD